jgi:activator of HSP90 ATPase
MLVPQLRSALQKLAPALIAEHGKDIQHAPSSTSSNTTTTTQSTVASKSVSSKPSTSSSSVNTTTLSSNDEFHTSAEQLQRVFTDPAMVTAFTRSPPQVWSGTAQGDKFVIFDGNVEGEFVSVSPTEVVQRWRLKQWPANHYSSLNLTFDQKDAEGVTFLRVKWAGIPIGQEEVTRKNWEEYYVKSIKICFGYGTVL